MDLSEKQTALCDENQTDFSDLRTVFFNCTLKHPDQASHTSLLIGTSAEIMRKSGVTVEDIRMTGASCPLSWFACKPLPVSGCSAPCRWPAIP